MKHNWAYKKLGDICSIVGRIGFRGYTRDDLVEKGNGAISLSPSNIIDGKLNFDDKVSYLSWEKYYESPEIMLAEGDVVFTKTASIGKCALVKKLPVETTLNPQLVVLKNIQCDSSYLTYTLQDKRFQEAVLSKKGGTSIPTISQAFLGSLPVPVPPIETQKQIVAELDKINETIEDCRELLRNLDALAQSLFFNYFGDPVSNPKKWPVKRLKALTSLITNGTTPKGGQAVYVDRGITFLRSQNVWRDRLVMDDVAYIDEETNATMKGSMLHHNDILITKTGRINTENSSLGRSALFTGEDNTANINGHVYLVRLNGTLNPRFVLTILLTESYRGLIRRVCVGAIDKRQLNLSHIEQFPIILPPLELQEKFSARVEQINEQKKIVENTIAELQTLLDSRMDYWFN